MIVAWSAVVLAAGSAHGAAPPATAPALRVGDVISADDLFALVARRYGLVIVNIKPLTGNVTITSDLPDDVAQAVESLNVMLKPLDGQAVLTPPVHAGDRVVLRIVTPREAKALALAVGPVSSGIDPKQIDVSDRDRMVTHLLPLAHADLLDAVSKAVTQDPGVSLTVTTLAPNAFQLILTGPAIKVRRAVETAIAIDKPPTPPVLRILKLKNLDAQTGADAMEQSFNRGPPEEMLRVTADPRTNSVLFSGPEMVVLEAMLTLQRMDDTPAPVEPAPHIEMPLRRLPVPEVPDTAPATRPGAGLMRPESPSLAALDEIRPALDNGGLTLTGGYFANMGKVRLLPSFPVPDSWRRSGDDSTSSSEKGEFFAV